VKYRFENIIDDIIDNSISIVK